MNVFNKNAIVQNNEIIATALKRARTNKNISLELASQKTGINKKYLAALEGGDFNLLPAGVYGKNFLKEYSLWLGLNAEEILALYNLDNSETTNKKTNKLFSPKFSKSHRVLNFPKILKIFAVIAIISACLLYLGFYLQRIISPPYLALTEPTADLTTASTSIKIIGISEKETEVLINGRATLVDSDGNFLEEVNLKSGLNTITITAQKKYSHKNEIIRKIYVK